jgi:RimJ/RimL family protein N-acetyltransferase
VQLTLARCTVRSWKTNDAVSLAEQANNRKIWLNLRDRFPHPYTRKDAAAFIAYARAMTPETLFAIDVEDKAVGGIGFFLQTDVERVSAEIGYWLGEPFWGRGIATDALSAVTQYGIAHYRLTRVFALPFAHNEASCRVLEKCGYALEGRLRRSIIKDGVIQDGLQYAFLAPPGE